MVIALRARLQNVPLAGADPEATEAIMGIAAATVRLTLLQAVATAVAIAVVGRQGAAAQGHAGPEVAHPSLTHQLK